MPPRSTVSPNTECRRGRDRGTEVGVSVARSTSLDGSPVAAPRNVQPGRSASPVVLTPEQEPLSRWLGLGDRNYASWGLKPGPYWGNVYHHPDGTVSLKQDGRPSARKLSYDNDDRLS